MSDEEGELEAENLNVAPQHGEQAQAAGHAVPAMAAMMGNAGMPGVYGLPTFHIRPPETLKLGSEPAENWKVWKQMWTHYCVVTNTNEDTRSREYLRSFFISTLGVEALQIYNGCDPEDTDTVEAITLKLDSHIL
jgi:hypothetical protein